MQGRRAKVGSGVLFSAFFALIIPLASVHAADEGALWRAHGGFMELEIRGDYLPDFGIEVEQHGRVIQTRERIRFSLEAVEPFQLLVPFGNFEALDPTRGQGRLRSGLVLRHGDLSVDLDDLSLAPTTWRNHPAFLLKDGEGRAMFKLTHLHVQADHQRGVFAIGNAEVEATPDLAALLGLEAVAGLPLGQAWLDIDLEIPSGADTSGRAPACDARPIWPQAGQFEAEVALIGMDTVAFQGLEPGTGRVKIAPSATLKNISQADIPWFRQFTSSPLYEFDPRDQHPFLVWNLYRIMDGRIEMLAESGVKHAFFSINVRCDINCGNGNILWPGCEDVYSSQNNDMSAHQGPKTEILASLGLWDNCGSFFDPDCTGSQTGFSGQWLNRLLVDPDEFQQPDASYFIDAWYVIQYDRNIWSTMGYRPVSPTPSANAWLFSPGTFRQGPVISEWVPETGAGLLADHQVIVVPSETPEAAYPGNMPQGHLRLLTRVIQVAPGRYRYNYALQNYDFERGVDRFHIPLASEATVFSSYFSGGRGRESWVVERDVDGVRFSPPTGQFQPWFTLYNFEIETDAPPGREWVRLGLAGNAVVDRLEIDMLAPSTTMPVFIDRFELSGLPPAVWPRTDRR